METDGNDTFLPLLRILPDACVELFVNLSSNPDTFSTVTGKMMFEKSQSFVVSRVGSFMDVQMKNMTGFISFCFYPSTAYLFFRLPMAEIADSLTDLYHLWGTDVHRMEEEIDKTPACQQKVDIIQQYLLNKLKGNRLDITLEYCVQQINHAQGVLKVEALAEKAGLSQRQLSRKFNHCLGLSTKEYININRSSILWPI